MESRTLHPGALKPLDATAVPPSDASPESSETSHTRLTPQSDSEDSGLELDELGESFELRRPAKGKEGVWDAEEGDDEDEDVGDGDGDGEYSTDRRRRGTSISTVQSYQLYTPDEERAVVRKFDRKLVLFVALLYMLSFLDRSNIGNAKIAGLDVDLDLDSNKYEWVLTAFYIAYICFEWMSILWKLVPAHIYITVIVLSWGLVASLQSLATSFAGLLVLRFLLGIGEAGFTGIPFYLSFFFKREELALRTGYFISAAPLATSFASTLAWAIIALGKRSPIASWRLLFLIEGFPSVLVAVIAWRVIPDSPSTAWYLTRREKKVARLRLRKEKVVSSHTEASSRRGLNVKEMLNTLTSPQTYLTALMFFFTNMAFSSMPVFLPSIMHSMGHSPLASQALSAPPYLLSFLAVLLTAYTSDRLRTRSTFIIAHSLLSACGYAFVALAGHQEWGLWWRYAGIYPACVGFFSVITIIITWSINNQENESRQGTGFAILQIVGQCGPLVGTRLYPETDAPLYVKGMSVCAGSMMLVAFLALGLRLYLGWKNKAVDEGEEVVYGKIGDEGHLNTTSRKRFKYML